MDATPSKTRSKPTTSDENRHGDLSQAKYAKLKKPPPITPRRFTRFFTPRPRNPSNVIKTSRAALRVISGPALNTRNLQAKDRRQSQSTSEATTPRGKKRKLSFVLAEVSAQSSPASRVSFISSSQDFIRSSPTIPERRTPIRRAYRHADTCDTEDETDIETEDEKDEDEGSLERYPRIQPYRSKTTSGSILSTRLNGRRTRKAVYQDSQWQTETGHFYTDTKDIFSGFTRSSVALPFSAAACHTNSLVAIGDEEGRIRLLDTTHESEHGLTRTWVEMRPHDNALMDLEFSADDKYLATASGDQTCQIIDVQTQTSLFLLGDHRCSVKKVAFQPSSGNQVLASCGRDGQVNFWDLRCNNMSGDQNAKYAARRKAFQTLPMTSGMKMILPTHMIHNAHTAGLRAKTSGPRGKVNMVPGRSDFSITSLCFLGDSKPHLLATASEIDSTIKIWDIRSSYGASRRAPSPLSIADEPRSHAQHRSFGITSLALNTDGSRLYSLSRDHTVYAYATSHLILGSSNQLSTKSKPSRVVHEHQGLGPLYGFRHPNLLIQSFWPRLAIRKATDSCTELLAVGSSDDCAVLFPTDERYLTNAAKQVSPLHQRTTSNQSSFSSLVLSANTARPALTRSNSSFANRIYSAMGEVDGAAPLPIYQHGTPLVRGHDKEVTSLAWSSEGNLVTASDDYTVRCWRERPDDARKMRLSGEKNGIRYKRGWSHIGVEDFDEEF